MSRAVDVVAGKTSYVCRDVGATGPYARGRESLKEEPEAANRGSVQSKTTMELADRVVEAFGISQGEDTVSADKVATVRLVHVVARPVPAIPTCSARVAFSSRRRVAVHGDATVGLGPKDSEG